MKKFSLISIFVVLAMLLAACGGGASNDATPGANDALATDNGLGMQTEEVGNGDFGLETEAVPTLDVSGSVDATQIAPGVESTDLAATPNANNGSTIPNTGAQVGEFAHLDQLKGMSLIDANGDSLGKINDFIIGVSDGRVDYLVVDRGGESILVPWSTLAFDRNNNAGFNFNGNLDAFNSVPAFSAGSVDFMNKNWDAAFIDAWRNPGSSTGGAGAAETAQPTQDSTSGQGDMSAAQQSTQTVGNEGLTEGPAFTNTVYAVLYSDLLNMNVVERAGASDAQNNAGAGDLGSAQSTLEPMSTPVATEQVDLGGQIGQSSQAGQDQSNTFQEGDSIGQIVGAIVNMTSGDLPYLVVSSDLIGHSATDQNQTGSLNATQDSSTVQVTPTVDNGSGAGTGSEMSNGSNAGFANFKQGVLVPFRLFHFIDENTAAVTFAGNVLQSAPVFSADRFPGPWNFGWDSSIGTFWQQNGNLDQGINP